MKLFSVLEGVLVASKEKWAVSDEWFVDGTKAVCLPSGLRFLISVCDDGITDNNIKRGRIDREVVPFLIGAFVGKGAPKKKGKGRVKGSAHREELKRCRAYLVKLDCESETAVGNYFASLRQKHREVEARIIELEDLLGA